MDAITKLRRKHARQNGTAAIKAMNDSHKYRLVGDNTTYTVGTRQAAYDAAYSATQRAENSAIFAARAAFAAHPELREGGR